MLAIYLAALDSADNAEAFEAVYERYKRLVYHVACQIVHDPHARTAKVHRETTLQVRYGYGAFTYVVVQVDYGTCGQSRML